MKTISDKHGEKYNIIIYDETSGPIFKVVTADTKIQETTIGHVYCSYREHDILTVADIHVRDEVVLVHRRTGWFWMFRDVKREKRNFRHRGIGAELLKCVFELAKAKGMRRIVGNIKKLDYSKNQKLPKWYSDMGFTVTMETEPSAVVAKLSKEL
jgi:hypothetical protein